MKHDVLIRETRMFHVLISETGINVPRETMKCELKKFKWTYSD